MQVKRGFKRRSVVSESPRRRAEEVNLGDYLAYLR
jgi:hypothetical protein